MRVVLALGGNALLRRNEPLEAEAQRRNLARAAQAIASVARRHQVGVDRDHVIFVGRVRLGATAPALGLRRFEPNLQPVRAVINGATRRIRV